MTRISETKIFNSTLLVVSHKKHNRLHYGLLSVSGGFPALTAQFAQHVAHLRLCVPVYSSSENDNAIDYPKNLQLVPLPPYRSRWELLVNSVTIFKTLVREIRNADLVYAMCPTDIGLISLLLARLFNKPVFISIDTDRAGMAKLGAGNNAASKLKAWVVGCCINGLLKKAGSNIPAFFTGSNFLGPHKLWRQWVKTTIKSSEMPPLINANTSILDSLQIAYVGRLAHEKNVLCLLRAVKELTTVSRKVSLKVIGAGPEREKLEQFCKKNTISNVSFLGEIGNKELKASHFFGVDVLVLPSLEERQGKVLLEAMAYSIPVIAARVGGIPSVVVDYETGLLFNPYSPEELTACLCKIMDQPALRRQLIKRGYDFALQNTLDLSVAQIFSEVTAFYKLQSHE
jgi:glycosyltransferase involved in cell wall biosynthesis